MDPVTVDIAKGFPLWAMMLVSGGSLGLIFFPVFLWRLYRYLKKRSDPNEMPLWAAALLGIGGPLALAFFFWPYYHFTAPDFNEITRHSDAYTFSHSETGASVTVLPSDIDRVEVTFEKSGASKGSGEAESLYMAWVFLNDGRRLHSEDTPWRKQLIKPLEAVGLAPTGTTNTYYTGIVEEKWALISLAVFVIGALAVAFNFKKRRNRRYP